MTEENPTRTLLCAAMGRHGEAVAEGPAGPVFVPYALPGETVSAGVDGRRARLAGVLAPSPDRIAPVCRHFGICGGCALQHWAPAPYAEWKRDLVATALAHRGIEAEVAPRVDAHGEGRRRAVLHARKAGGRTLVGFMAMRSHSLVPIEACPVLAPALAAAPRIAAAIAVALAPLPRPLDLHMTATPDGIDCNVQGTGEPSGPALARLAAAAAELARLSFGGETLIERRPPVIPIGRARVVLPPGSFLQATEAGEAALAGLVSEALAGARRIADLFCGIGPFALRLAEAAQVAAYDSDAPAVDALARAARHAPGLKPVAAKRRDLFRVPLSAAELDRFDAVVIDPPRQGAQAQAAELARSTVKRIACVSCDPASFARDAALLISGGYRLASVTPVDQFRWTAHVEIVGIFER